ncbi:glyoxylase-like metal-dependent hydrolase (beta-lactamase superfamily II) [Aliiruegeria haliotis]|uniref:Glyoxylase-like metal-dependent hydrolase (Beta-lactamase superfamily II) n=1 Tax=Aliiruegeria haliotis TaxID=1280846 RepID=A0A2T0RJU9_9RHOB|nr:MBL fold metallo-hydrolase [Aliiruegeria haliotis]PRY21397.1 glyoxylase-like metal-dependent hydrolase (beta-lactamase superfamily II) [Aliiruegeria haliotis]
MTPPALSRLEPGLRRILAPNPSPMTHTGTNSYILGEGRVAVIDPGPALKDHFDAILAALSPGETISHILVTHSHLDHSPLSRPLSEATGAPILAFGTHEQGRSPVMAALAAAGLAGGGEGIDMDFQPHERLLDGQLVTGDGWQVEALWTPGHIANHLCFAWEDALFSGDHVMGWASSLVSPPDGDLTAFMASCERLRGRSDRVFYPGHGDPVTAPADRLDWLIGHRRVRDAQIRDQLGAAALSVPEITARVYTDTPRALLPAAERNVFAHLIDLSTRNLAQPVGEMAFEAHFRAPTSPQHADTAKI